MASLTTNYHLTKPAQSDFYDVGDFNDNADKIDTQMKKNEDAAATNKQDIDDINEDLGNLDDLETPSKTSYVNALNSEHAIWDKMKVQQHFNDGTFEGRDLTVLFADEIAQFTGDLPAWQWIQDRINHEDATGLLNGDYIPLTLTNNETLLMQININPYKGACDQELPFHIDFISKDCMADTVKWNTSNNNNGNSTSAHPYLVSNLYNWLTNTVLPRIPVALRSIIAEKRFLLETRYTSGSTLTDSTSWAWQSLGKIWPLSEFEVFGCVVWGTKGWSAGQAIRYPIFHNWKDMIKHIGTGGSRCYWWLLTPHSGGSTGVCYVYDNGCANHNHASNGFRVPLCFRLKKNS